jgi:hypothetical protein
MPRATFRKFLFLALLLNVSLSLTAPVFAAQSNSSAPNPINTVWQSPVFPFSTSSGTAYSRVFFLFEKDGTVIECAVSTLPSQLNSTPNFFNPMYNPVPWTYQEGAVPYSDNSPFRLRLTMTPGFIASVQAVGSYRRNGNTLQIEFDAWSGTAELAGDEIALTRINKSSGKKEAWKLEKIPNDSLPRQNAGTGTAVEPRIIPPSNASDWTFSLRVDRMVGIIGLVREESHQFDWLLKLGRDGEELKGIIASGRGEHGESVCAEATVAGSVKNGVVTFVVTYEGTCCHLAQMKFTGRLSDDGKTMTGNLEPVDLPKTAGCSLVYATVTASRH